MRAQQTADMYAIFKKGDRGLPKTTNPFISHLCAVKSRNTSYPTLSRHILINTTSKSIPNMVSTLSIHVKVSYSQPLALLQDL